MNFLPDPETFMGIGTCFSEVTQTFAIIKVRGSLSGIFHPWVRWDGGHVLGQNYSRRRRRRHRRLAAQGLYYDAQGLCCAAQGLYSVAQGLHYVAQGFHYAAQVL